MPALLQPQVSMAVSSLAPMATIWGSIGLQMDRADITLRTPSHARIIATSSDLHSRPVPKCHRRKSSGDAGTRRESVCRSTRDVVYFDTGHGGAVFSVGSIDWTSALSENSFDNDIAHITVPFCTPPPVALLSTALKNKLFACSVARVRLSEDTCWIVEDFYRPLPH